MGFFHASAPVQLTEVYPPVGLSPHFISKVPTTLVLKEKVFSWSGDDFSVNDTFGQTVIRCRGKAFSFRDKKVITDPQGNVMFHLVDKLLSMHKTYLAKDGRDNTILEVKKRWGIRTVIEGVFTNFSTGQLTAIEMRGDFWGGSADLILGDQVIAQITRKLFNAREMFGDKQTYYVTVAPGVDLALIATLCICLDEAKNEGNNGN